MLHIKKAPFALTTLCVVMSLLGGPNAHARATPGITAGPHNDASDLLDDDVLPEFEGGTLTMDVAGQPLTSNFTFDSSTTNTFDEDGNVNTLSGTLTNAVSGTPGNIVFANTGAAGGEIIITNGSNSYTGTTTIESNATVALSGYGTIGASSLVTVDGTLDLRSASEMTAVVINNLAGSGTVEIGANELYLSNAGGTFSGKLTGTADLVKDGTGTFTLNGDNSGFTGLTYVFAGTLEVGDASNTDATLGGDVNIYAGATLSGHGTVLGDVTNSGIVSPGGTIGTLTVGGDYSQGAAAALNIEVSPTTASRLAVNGEADLAGSLNITFDPGTYSAKTYNLVTAAGGVQGTFDTVTKTGTSNLNGLTSAVTYSTDDVNLVLSGTGTGTGDVIVAPTDTTIFSAMGTSAMLGAQATETSILNHISDSASKQTTPSGAWASATGSYNRVHGTDTPFFDDDRYGFLAGVDHRVGDYTLGSAFGFDHSVINESNTGDSGTIDSVRAAAYASRFVGPVNLAAVVGGGLDVISQKREFGSEGDARGTHNGGNALAGLQASLPMNVGGFTVSPQLGLRYTYFRADDFYEHGAGGEDLRVGADSQNSLQPYAGVAVGRIFDSASAHPIQMTARLGYARELLSTRRSVDVTSLDGTDFSADGSPMSRNYLSTGLSAGVRLNKATTVSVSYDTMINTSRTSSQTGSLNLAYRF